MSLLQKKARPSTYAGVDILKFLFSICIVMIHTDITFVPDWIVYVFFRLGVPYFMVASGYFFGEKLYEGNVSLNDLTRSYIKRLGTKLLVFELINLPLVMITTRRNLSLINNALYTVRSILFYPVGALWYIQAVLVAILLIYPLVKRGKEAWAIPVGIFLYGFALICNRYYFLVENTVLGNAMILYRRYFVSARNGFFLGVLYISIGMFFAKKKMLVSSSKKVTSVAAVLTFAGLVCLLLEVALLEGKPGIDDCALFISHLILIPALFVFSGRLQTRRLPNTRIIRNLSTSFYLLHGPINRIIECLEIYVFQHAFFLPEKYLALMLGMVITCCLVYKTKKEPIYSLIR